MNPLTAEIPLRLCVERLRHAKDPAIRQLRIENGDLLCQLTATFARPAAGPSYQDVSPRMDLPAPEDLPSTREQANAEGWSEYARGPIEFRRAWPRI